MQRTQSLESITSITSCRVGDKRCPPTHVVIAREGDNKKILLPITNLVNSSVARIKFNHTTTFKENANSRKQYRGKIVQLGSRDVCMEQLEILEMTADIDQDKSISSDIDEATENESFEHRRQSSQKQNSKSIDSSKWIARAPKTVATTGHFKQSCKSGKSNDRVKSTSLQVNDGIMTESDASSDEDDGIIDKSDDSFKKNRSSTKANLITTTAKGKTTAIIKPNSSSGSTIEYQSACRKTSKSKIIVSNRDSDMNESRKSIQSIDLPASGQDEGFHDIGSSNLSRRFDDLSKKCHDLLKENTALQLECNCLTKEIQELKRSTMPIPDAAGCQWFINMGKYFSNKTPDVDVLKYSKALNIADPRDLISCIQDTTSNTARHVVRLLYSTSQLATMTGPEIPSDIRAIIREFAESQKGPISNHKFNEAINGVFRAKKCELKSRTQSKTKLIGSENDYDIGKLINCRGDGNKSLKSTISKTQRSISNDSNRDKENYPGEAVADDDD